MLKIALVEKNNENFSKIASNCFVRIEYVIFVGYALEQKMVVAGRYAKD